MRQGFRSESEGIEENRVNTVAKVFLIIKVGIENETGRLINFVSQSMLLLRPN